MSWVFKGLIFVFVENNYLSVWSVQSDTYLPKKSITVQLFDLDFFISFTARGPGTRSDQRVSSTQDNQNKQCSYIKSFWQKNNQTNKKNPTIYVILLFFFLIFCWYTVWKRNFYLNGDFVFSIYIMLTYN